MSNRWGKRGGILYDTITGPVESAIARLRHRGIASTRDEAEALPLIWGRVKLPIVLIEKFAPIAQGYPLWQESWPVQVGMRCFVPDAGVYECISAGSTNSDANKLPTGKGDVVDGGVTWRWKNDLTVEEYYQTFLASVCEGVANVAEIWVGTDHWELATAADLPYGLKWRQGYGGDAVIPDEFDQCGYPRTACLYSASAAMSSGTQVEIPDISVEVVSARNGLNESPVIESYDVTPTRIISDLLDGNQARAITAYSPLLDASAAAQHAIYCNAAGLRCSLALTEQVSTLDAIRRVLEVSNSDAVWSNGTIKLVPLGDREITDPVYGTADYTPDNQAVANLGPDDFLELGPTGPIEITRRADGDCPNRHSIIYKDRGQAYSECTQDYHDTPTILAGALEQEDALAAGVVFADATPATYLAQARAQRATYSRNQYRFRLSWRYMLLEPTDIVTLTEAALGLDLHPVRITEISESESGIEITAEEWPEGIAVAGGYQPQIGDGLHPAEPSSLAHQVSVFDGARFVADRFTVPGASLLEAPLNGLGELLINGGLEIWSPESAYGTCPPDAWTTIYTDVDSYELEGWDDNAGGAARGLVAYNPLDPTAYGSPVSVVHTAPTGGYITPAWSVPYDHAGWAATVSVKRDGTTVMTPVASDPASLEYVDHDNGHYTFNTTDLSGGHYVEVTTSAYPQADQRLDKLRIWDSPEVTGGLGTAQHAISVSPDPPDAGDTAVRISTTGTTPVTRLSYLHETGLIGLIQQRRVPFRHGALNAGDSDPIYYVTVRARKVSGTPVLRSITGYYSSRTGADPDFFDVGPATSVTNEDWQDYTLVVVRDPNDAYYNTHDRPRWAQFGVGLEVADDTPAVLDICAVSARMILT